jgi:ubiquinone/menaquinone biosynthesis C-methylase UbiE
MKKKREKNISVFNKYIQRNFGYVYTNNNVASAKIATTKQTRELVEFVNKYFSKDIKIIDIGCGDGTYTIDLYKLFSPRSITGFDAADQAIKIAQKKIKKSYKNNVKFKVGNIYDVDKLFKKGQFDLAIIRGVLHHLYNPQKAIKNISKVFPEVIILEANGYNPILKVIEKTSPYHREHEEKSYFPPTLNGWFNTYGYKVIDEYYFGIVPYFFPEKMAKLLKKMEPFFENIPYLNRLYCACNLILYRKNT